MLCGNSQRGCPEVCSGYPEGTAGRQAVNASALGPGVVTPMGPQVLGMPSPFPTAGPPTQPPYYYQAPPYFQPPQQQPSYQYPPQQPYVDPDALAHKVADKVSKPLE